MNGAVVTGVGANNIGFGVAKRLAEAGTSLVVADRRPIAEQVCDALRQAGAPVAHAIELDVGDQRSVEGGFDKAFSLLPQLDALAHCAGISEPTAPLDITAEMWDRMVSVNLRGTFLCCQAFIRRLQAAGRRGSIVNIASMAAFSGGRHNGVHYAASKAGVVALTKGLARYFGKDQIRVNAVAPGIIATALATDFDFFVKQGQSSPLGRLGEIEEVGDAVTFLLSDRSSYVTGTTVEITGGI
jgi:3-oxoacyl-[acyl-carrier protein] reductase